MSIFPRLLLLALIATPAAYAADTTPTPAGPTEASIRDLMTITQSRKLVDSVPEQVQSAMQSAMQEAFDGQDLTAAQQKVLDAMGAKTTALFKKEMGWEVLEPLFIAVYGKTFTQSEIDGMIAFYKSEPGKAVIAKMPLVMQSTMDLVEERMMAMRPQLQALQQEAIEQLQPTEKEEGPGK